MKNYRKSNPLKILLPPLLTFCMLALFVVFVLRILGAQILKQKEALNDAAKLVNMLKEKETVLQQNRELLPALLTKAIASLPEENQAIKVYGRLFNLSIENKVLLKDLSMNLPVKAISEDKKMEFGYLSFTASGSINDINNFLKAIGNATPRIYISSVEFVKDGSDLSGLVASISYWSSYPKEFPSVLEPITKLSDEETVLIENLPQEISENYSLPPAASYGRSSPF